MIYRSRYPATAAYYREVESEFADDGEGRIRAAVMYVLHAVEAVLRLDEQLDPEKVETPAVRQQCAIAITDLKEAMDCLERVTKEDAPDLQTRLN